MKKKRVIIISISLIAVLLVFFKFIYPMVWLAKLNVRQLNLGESIPEKCRIERELIVDDNGYFCIDVLFNNKDKRQLIIDTQATCLARIDTLERLGARYWDDYPVNVRNLYGQKEKLPLYELESISIDQLSLQKPLMKGFSENNAIYQLLYKEVLGKDILQHLVWKFDLDDDKLILFSNKNESLLNSEVQDYQLIEGGLAGKAISLSFPAITTDAYFTLDLGYQGEISIDDKLYKELSKNNTPLKCLNLNTDDTIDTTYVFQNIDVSWKNIPVKNCNLYYYPERSLNQIGAPFMKHFNFILAYLNVNHKRKKDLYIKDRCTNQDINLNLSFLASGFGLEYLNDKLTISTIVKGSSAEKTGLKLRDEVIEIDNGAFELTDYTVSSGLVFTYLLQQKSIHLKVQREQEMKNFDIEF